MLDGYFLYFTVTTNLKYKMPFEMLLIALNWHVHIRIQLAQHKNALFIDRLNDVQTLIINTKHNA